MPLSTFGVVSAITPSVIETYFSHFLNRAPLREKPTAHISYHEGLRLIREFLDYSAKHTVEDLQAFTAQWVPAPTWVRIQDVEISAQYLEKSARLLQEQLGPSGIELVGGKTWWQWRRPDTPLKAEWVEMKKDYNERKRSGGKAARAILYVHGGAYYFGSVDEHRYQIQRHARKLKARVFAPRYRLSPQYPFPCGLQDCIAAYFRLLEDFQPNQILFAGDSAGGGMVLSMLVTLRDQQQPLPAGTILLSPWVDLTHSFPSVAGDGAGDYIPPHGFHHKPSMVWPPPNSDELRALAATPIKKKKSKDDLSSMSLPDQDRKVPHPDRDLSIYVNGERVTIKDQIQMYTTNYMLAHPLVSPVQQPSLGGLPPMLIQVGGAELLRDEQIYIAHKAANPAAYPPSQTIMNEYMLRNEDVDRYPPTDVQLQLWDDLCHVPHTLSFTRPAKYMYRSVAQFGAWALGEAQNQSVPRTDDDHLSIISSGPGTDSESSTNLPASRSRNGDQVDRFRPTDTKGQQANGTVGRAGDPLPPFQDHMIRQRVDRHGVTYALTPESDLPCLHLDPESIGAIKPGPVGKWLKYKKATDSKFSSDKKKVQKKRLKEMQQGYTVAGENEYPPPTALAGRRTADMPADKKLKKSWGLAMWSGWGSSHDESQIEREEKLERVPSHRPESREPTNVAAAVRTPEPAEIKPFGGSPTPEDRQAGASNSSIFSGFSEREERSVSPFVAGVDDGPAERTAIGGSNLRPPNEPISRSVSRTSSRHSATASQQNVNVTQAPAASTGSTKSTPVTTTTSEYTLSSSALPRVHSHSSDRVHSPTSGIDDVPTPQDMTSSNLTDGPMAYPFKIRNPVPGYTSSAASSNGDAIEAQTSSTLFPSEPFGGNGTRPNFARPISSMHAFSDKEFVMPAAEKEVILESSSSPSTPIDGRNMPFRMRNAPADSRVRLEMNHLTPVATNASQASSIPPSPAASYAGKAPDFQYRNPAFDPRATAARVFGASQYDNMNPADQIRSAAPPKPVGFTYNPRDLRNAMLNRAAAERASASRGHSPGPASAQSHQISHPFGGAVELPATAVMSPMSHRSSHETLGRGSTASPTASRASDNSKTTATTSATGASSSAFTDFQLPDPEPVELSADPATRAPPPPPPPPPTGTNLVPPFNRPDLAVRENITMPVVEPKRNSKQPPPPPPKDDTSAEARSPRQKQSAEVLVKGRSTPGEKVSSPRVETSAPPVISKLAGLEEVNKSFDLGLDGAAGQDEEKPPAWL